MWRYAPRYTQTVRVWVVSTYCTQHTTRMSPRLALQHHCCSATALSPNLFQGILNKIVLQPVLFKFSDYSTFCRAILLRMYPPLRVVSLISRLCGIAWYHTLHDSDTWRDTSEVICFTPSQVSSSL